MIRQAIAKLVDGQNLTREEAHGALRVIMSGDATPAQIGAFITALRIRGETPEVIAGCAQAMRENLTPVAAPAGPIVDIVGTGGDGAHTFNISTAAALVTAAAGVVVAKHGNRNVSSKCGSADVLAALGVNIGMPPDRMADCLQRIGMAFLFAPTLHPAMKHATGPRREIGIRTIFNILGPLSNPAGAQRGVLGVYSRQLVPVMAAAAADLGAEHLFVVHGLDGLDEITTTTGTLVGEVRQGQVRIYEIHPAQFGIPVAQKADLVGGEPADNAVIIRRVLANHPGPQCDIVRLNAAAALVAGGRAADIPAGIAVAAEMLASGAAMKKLNELVAFTQEA